MKNAYLEYVLLNFTHYAPVLVFLHLKFNLLCVRISVKQQMCVYLGSVLCQLHPKVPEITPKELVRWHY